MDIFVSWFAKIFLAPFVKMLFLKEIKGKKNLPDEKHNFILASNHQSHLDLLVNGYICVPRKFRYVGQVDQYTGMQGFLRDVIYLIAGTIPMDRRSKDSKKEAMQIAADCLRKGENIIVFPEGTRTRTGAMGAGKIGSLKLAVDTDKPIVPVGITGVFDLLPPGGKLKIRKQVKANVGSPMYFQEEKEKLKALSSDSPEYREILEEMAKKLMARIKELKDEIEK
ncbi:MAG TPA: lysophospholipid acyltransferase family protein [Candidatus Pacearchaeota archaeon]|nr:lysophospholipid acyltransferase family protein [Candidatus Pacearchaeota archaeon]HOU45679.1 lysophospholipid acyltransferase family protein [Candidatus Pacearchaeota archaeon]HPM08506.1 lysophospholipid acyltransferase family protein [Candidatus Pacearchaeota archaeon]HQI74608.1 lysophospholipid acyltransferase family protein [Candidatus Pacearchaeota archaeon]